MMKLWISFFAVAGLACGNGRICGGDPPFPTGTCTAQLVGVMVCPAGPGAGRGFRCAANGCWEAAYDGPCMGVFVSDAGVSCPTARTCATHGEQSCSDGLRYQCERGCAVPIDACR